MKRKLSSSDLSLVIQTQSDYSHIGFMVLEIFNDSVHFLNHVTLQYRFLYDSSVEGFLQNHNVHVNLIFK